MKTKQIKGTSFLTFFGEKGITIGNDFFPHDKWRNFKFKDLRNMPRMAMMDFANNADLFKKMYERLTK